MKKLKYVKTFENFENFKVNEEISLSRLVPIIASLFLTFSSFKVMSFPTGGASGGKRYGAYTTQEIRKIADKIEIDLQRLKSETQDPELIRLIESVNTLDGWRACDDGMDQVYKVVSDLRNYIEKQKINHPLVNDTLNNLTTGDIESLEENYQMLLQMCEEVDQTLYNRKLMSIIMITLVVTFFVILGLKVIRHGIPG